MINYDSKKFYDLESPTAIVDPCQSNDILFLDRAQKIFADWCNANHVVAIVRFHPFIANQNIIIALIVLNLTGLLFHTHFLSEKIRILTTRIKQKI